MAYNEALTARVREALMDVPKVEEKRMFRGVTFMVDGKMCITAGDEHLMLRVDPELHDVLVEEEGVIGVIMRGREYRGYIRVPTDVMQTERSFAKWIGLALDFNVRAKATVKRKKKGE